MSELYTKKTKIQNGKWGYRSFVIEKVDKLWDVIGGEMSIRERIEPDKTIKAVCLQIDELLGYAVTKYDNEKTSERKKPIKKSDNIKKDIEKILINNFSKTRKSKFIYDENGKPSELSFEIIALDSVYKYNNPIALSFDSDTVKAKRLELVSMIENTSNTILNERLEVSKELLVVVNKEKYDLGNDFSGFQLMLERSKLDEKYWFPISFSIGYVDNTNFTPNIISKPKEKNLLNDDNISY